MTDEAETEYYPIPLVGEQYYQSAVALCEIGDIIDICIERGNPFDDQALVARRRKGGRTIGYIARDSFVQRVIHMEGGSIVAAVLALRRNRRGFTDVVLHGAIFDDAAAVVDYRPGDAEPWTEAAPPPAPIFEAVDAAPPASIASPVNIIIGVAIIVLLVRCMG